MTDAITGDLFFRAKIEEAARAVGAPLPRFVSSAEKVSAELVILELSPRTGGVEAVAKILERSPGARVVAFGSHVDTEMLDRARSLGAAEVMPRSRFVREMGRILLGQAPEVPGEEKPVE
ncbi:DNA-binding response regulator [bacterium]|nr:DNA-binding response regulator [bacterium]